MNSNYIDWFPILPFIPNKKEKTILELGCGLGTKKLCEEFERVLSFETSRSDEWYVKTTKDLESFQNWRGHFKSFDHYGFSDSDPKLLSSNGLTRDLTPLDLYITELESFVDLSEVDVGFIDQGFHLRGETVNFLMSKGIPFIFLHDLNESPQLYGWNLIEFEKYNYEGAVSISSRQGTLLLKKNK